MRYSVVVLALIMWIIVIPAVSSGEVILFEDFNTDKSKVIATAPTKEGVFTLPSGIWGYVISGEYGGPCHVGGPPEIKLVPSITLSNGQKSQGGALNIIGGDEYYCDGWRTGGPTYVYYDLQLPENANKITFEVKYGIPGYSDFARKPTDAYIIIKVKDLNKNTEKILKRQLIGGDFGCGWFVDKFDISEFKGHKVRLIFQAKAGGTVRVCSYCTGTWDGETISIDYVKVNAEGLKPKPNLKLTINCESLLKQGEIRTAELTIENVGNKDAKDVKTTIYSSSLGINIQKSYDLIPPKEARTITFKVAPNEAGKFTIKAMVEYWDDIGNKYIETTEKTIIVEATEVITETTLPTGKGVSVPGFTILTFITSLAIVFVLRRLR